MTDTGGNILKVDIINDAYSQLRISGLTVNPSPADLEVALNRLESMAAEWSTRNMSARYIFEDIPDPNTEAGIVRGFKQAFATNLAIRLIPDFNKAVAPTLYSQASQSASNLAARTALVREVPYPNRQPRGRGNIQRTWRWSRFYFTANAAPISEFTIQMFIGDINDFEEHFDAYLEGLETIDTYTIESDSGLQIEGDVNTDEDVLFTIKALGSNDNSSNEAQQVKIVVTTTTGRIETRLINFNLRNSDNAF